MTNYTKYYFLGIGGIGMSALARYFKAKGCEVSGYDRTKTPLTEELEAEGIPVHYSAQFPPFGRDAMHCVSTENTLVVYTPAVPEDFEEFVYFKNNGFRMLKRAQVLGEITRESKGICIAGTHGKTTVSTMTAHLIYQSHVGCSAFLGGVSKNYNTNLLTSPNPSKGGELHGNSLSVHTKKEQSYNSPPLEGLGEVVVIEADEYDRSFHQLSPFMALITAVDADHLDIYGDKDEFRRGFEKFASLVKENGFLVVKEGLDLQAPPPPKGGSFEGGTAATNVRECGINIESGTATLPPLGGGGAFTYGMQKGDFHAENIKIENGEIHFDFVTPTETVKDIQLGVPVLINVENSVGAMALAYLAGVKPDELRSGMASYAGIRRRFDIQLKSEKLVYLDDYAHHPEELRASITSIKTLFPGRKICGIFQPHLYTRTRDFMDGFAETLSLLDDLILVDIYPARELPIEGISSDIIFDKVTIANKTRAKKEELLDILKNKELDVLVTLGAGDIDAYVPKIKELLSKQVDELTSR